jgi:hypothetical protein
MTAAAIEGQVSEDWAAMVGSWAGRSMEPGRSTAVGPNQTAVEERVEPGRPCTEGGPPACVLLTRVETRGLSPEEAAPIAEDLPEGVALRWAEWSRTVIVLAAPNGLWVHESEVTEQLLVAATADDRPVEVAQVDRIRRRFEAAAESDRRSTEPGPHEVRHQGGPPRP